MKWSNKLLDTVEQYLTIKVNNFAQGGHYSQLVARFGFKPRALVCKARSLSTTPHESCSTHQRYLFNKLPILKLHYTALNCPWPPFSNVILRGTYNSKLPEILNHCIIIVIVSKNTHPVISYFPII